MTKRKKNPDSPKPALDIVELITGRIAKITALVTAVGGLVVVIVNQSGTLSEMLAKLRPGGDKPACLQAETLVVPTTVKYSEWDNMTLKLNGSNDCSMDRGVYVAFDAPKGGLFLKEEPGCEGPGAWKEPGCWESRKPIKPGSWQIELMPPPLDHVRDLRPVEKISLRWWVYDYDAPTERAMRADATLIEVENDVAQLH